MKTNFINDYAERIESARAELASIQREKMQTLYEHIGNLPTPAEVRLTKFFDKYTDLVSAGLI